MHHQRVKQHIWESFCKLLETTPFEKLTVERIAAHSGVAKATFYRHFRDKYDVMNYNSDAMVLHLTGGHGCQSWQEFYSLLFQEMQKNREYYRKVFRTSGQNAHTSFVYEYCFGFVKSRYLAACRREELNREEQYQIRLYCHGCVDTLEDWLWDARPMAAQELAALYEQAMPAHIRAAWQAEGEHAE